jgi:hypothetical protein
MLQALAKRLANNVINSDMQKQSEATILHADYGEH